MSSQLHQAVQLAQSGQREQAAALLRQVVASDPNNEGAWLWLASVAADRAEYARALDNVLRINPGNQQAAQALAEYRASQPEPSPAPSPVEPAPVEPAPAPPTPVEGQPDSSPGLPEPAPAPIPVSGQPIQAAPGHDAPAPTPSKPARRRGCGCLPGGCLGCGGGCGCIQGCLIGLLLIVALPLIGLLALSMGDFSLGPLDLIAAELPGDMGRKSIEFEVDDGGTAYDVTLDVPRSWYLAAEGSEMWDFASDVLDDILTFREPNRSWADYENTPGQIVETQPITLAIGGQPIEVEWHRVVSDDFACPAVQARAEEAGYDEVVELDEDLCGFREDDVQAGPATPVFDDVDTPGDVRTITFTVPQSATQGTTWQITIPDKVYPHFRADIRALIKSIEVVPAGR